MSSRLRADFQPHELSGVLEQYDLGAIQHVEKQLKGSRRSPKVLITSDRGKFVLKRRARGRDHPVKVATSHHVQQYLAKRDFPLPHLVASKVTGETMVVLFGMTYEMFEFVSGTAYDHTVETTRDTGRVLALLHKYLREYRVEWEPSRRGFHDSHAVRTHLNSIPASIGKDDSVAGKESELLSTVSSIYELYESASHRVNDAGYYDWPSQLIHADWHPGNMLFHDGKVAAVIDYDSIHMLPPIMDVANGALQFSILGGPSDPRTWPAELDEPRLQAFVSGYDNEQAVPTGGAGLIERRQLGVLAPLMIEALIAEAVLPIAATGSFGRMEGFRFLQMVNRKVRWLHQNGPRLLGAG